MLKKTRSKFFKFIIILMVFFCFVYGYYTVCLVPIIKTYCSSKINALTEQALNVAVSNVINSSINYDNMVSISYNNHGEVSYISANQYMINTITREVVKDAHQQIKILDEEYIKIPIGTLSGIALFMGRGPRVRLSATPIGIVGSSFDSRFVSVGVNNTLHKIYLKVNARVEMALPVKKHVIDVEQQVLLCESVIVGKVPNVYLNSGTSDKLLNLIPN